ncbi:ribonuclease P protein subunit p25-like protein [Oryzias latipes]|uniref:ribonuclease P protein subunit p25-like protein n=1 Tax=Oryzias latipes TaxID=8090 RepID=UPI0002A48F1F|nr:ribonuclease P protein subunit p25-like protein [Oryzias latipes]
MENYSRARSVEQPSVCPFAGLAADTPELRVKDGSKIRNLLRFALSRMEAKRRGGEEDEGGQRVHAACPQMVFTASGKAVSKAITCAEIVKRRVKGLHQLTRLLHSTVVEVWEPLEPAAGLDSLNVSRKLPAVWILLSREPLDSSQPGYQAPGCYDNLWALPTSKEEGGGMNPKRPGSRRKRGGGAGGGGGGGGGSRGKGRPRDAAKGWN